MKIQGELGEYQVHWRSFGWSYVEAVVCIPIWWGLWNKEVWSERENCKYFRTTAMRMHPNETRRWFRKVVRDYEQWRLNWEAEDRKVNNQ